MMHRLALVLGRQAARVLHPANPVQARAMLAELDYLEGSASLAWAFGCLMASCRQRANLLAVCIVTAQSCVALAAGAFGFLHAYVSFENLRTKIMLIAGQGPAPSPGSFLYTINAQSLEHWLWMFLVFTAGGMLHVIAAILMAIGSRRAMSNSPFCGCTMTITPAKPARLASQRLRPICSPSNRPAIAVTKSGAVKNNATTSASGMIGKAR